MIKLNNISKHYPQQKQQNFALRDITIQVDAGEIFGIIGRSGAGKSTLVRCINVLERPSKGEVWIGDVNVTALSGVALRKERREIGMIFQHFNLLESRSVLGNVALPLELIGWSKSKIAEKVLPLLKLVGLQKYAEAKPSELSGGQKQRVAIARALASDPKVLLCDEATSALDPETTISILQLLKKINQKLGLTIVLITHEMDVIKQLCDRVAVLDQGRVVEQASVLDIFTRPKHEVTKSLTRAALHTELPQALQAKLKSHPAKGRVPLVRLGFVGDQVDQPVLAHLSEQFKVDANIALATLEYVQDTPVGVTVCELLGAEAAVKKAIAYIKGQHINLEGLGYVSTITTTAA